MTTTYIFALSNLDHFDTCSTSTAYWVAFIGDNLIYSHAKYALRKN